MLKSLGLLIVLLSCIYMGNTIANTYKKRFKHLLMISQLIDYFETEIIYTSTPVIEMFENIREKINEPFKSFLEEVLFELHSSGYKPLSEIWKIGLQNNKERLCLKNEDIELLIYFGNIIGTTDKENHKKYFTVIKKRLDGYLNDAEKEKGKYIKLYRQLGVLVGIFLTILII